MNEDVLNQLRPGALAGLRVLDCGQIIAAPFAACLLADFGAEVIKVEQPGIGDAYRGERGSSFGWAADDRNKRSVTLDLRRPEGQALLKRLVAVSDVLIENFLPGTMERWGLDYGALAAVNERLIMLRCSGFGQTGPYARKYSFDRIGLAIGGMTYVTGFPDRPPARPGYFVADYGTGLFGAFAVLMAIYNRDVTGSGRGQMIDVSLYETVWKMSGTIAAQYASNGQIRERNGNTVPGVVPAEQFETRDGRYVVVHAGTDRVFKRLCETIGRPELGADPRYATPEARRKHQDALHAEIAEWVRGLTQADCLARLDAGGVPGSPVFSIADIFADPHFAARGNIVRVKDPLLGEVAQPGIYPHLSATPGAIRRPAPLLGEANAEIYGGLLGIDAETLRGYEAAGVI
jgi:crotonobetainyl-CoA:carnitine CoA-transferase CaiB-like acyl-CoA transferase